MSNIEVLDHSVCIAQRVVCVAICPTCLACDTISCTTRTYRSIIECCRLRYACSQLIYFVIEESSQVAIIIHLLPTFIEQLHEVRVTLINLLACSTKAIQFSFPEMLFPHTLIASPSQVAIPYRTKLILLVCLLLIHIVISHVTIIVACDVESDEVVNSCWEIYVFAVSGVAVLVE